MVGFSRLTAGETLQSLVSSLIAPLEEASDPDSARYLQGLSLCLLVDYAAGAPHTDYNALCFSQGVDSIVAAAKRSMYCDMELMHEIIELSDRYLSLPIEYIDPGSEEFKQLIRYLLAQLQDAHASRAALLVDSILACYLDLWAAESSNVDTSSSSSTNLLTTWTLILLSFARMTFEQEFLSTDRLGYILCVLKDAHQNRGPTQFLQRLSSAIKIASKIRHYKPLVRLAKRRKIHSKLRKLMHFITKDNACRLHIKDKSLVYCHTHGSLPFGSPACARPQFPKAINKFTYSRYMESVFTRRRTVLADPPNSAAGPSELLIQCKNIAWFLTSEEFCAALSKHYSLGHRVALSMLRYSLESTQTHAALLLLTVDAQKAEREQNPFLMRKLLKKIIRAPSPIIGSHAVSIVVSGGQ